MVSTTMISTHSCPASPLLASPALCNFSPRPSFTFTRLRTPIACEIFVEVNGSSPSSSSESNPTPSPGSRIRVLAPLIVFHVPKHPSFDLGGFEGEIKDVLKTWKGKPISPNLPFKVQFNLELDGKPVKFFAHLKESEFEVIG